MPAGKKQDAMTLTFSRKNKDIYDFLEDRKKDKNFIATDYICEAVRFYNVNKDLINNLNVEAMSKLLEIKFLNIAQQPQQIKDEKVVDKLEYIDKAALESKIEDINIEDD